MHHISICHGNLGAVNNNDIDGIENHIVNGSGVTACNGETAASYRNDKSGENNVA